jgi:hypothetical protein
VAPYGGDSRAGQTLQGGIGVGSKCTPFVPSSQYVLLEMGVLACFNPQWPVLIFKVAYFEPIEVPGTHHNFKCWFGITAAFR